MDSTDYQTIAEFRYQIRTFLHFSEEEARKHGLNGQQHQLLLAIKGLPDGVNPTISALAERMHLRHHSTVELLDRLSDHGYVARGSDPEDGRQVRLRITPKGNAILRKLTAIHGNELKTLGPLLSKTLQKLIHENKIRSS